MNLPHNKQGRTKDKISSFLPLILVITFLMQLTHPAYAMTREQSQMLQVANQGWVAIAGNDGSVRIIKPDGSGNKIIYKDSSGSAWIYSLEWSKEGRFLGFIVRQQRDLQLWIWDSSIDKLYMATGDLADSARGYSWNPAIDEIVVFGKENGSQIELILWDAIQQNSRVLVSNYGSNFQWVDDGNRIIFDMMFESSGDPVCPELPTWINKDGIYSYDVTTKEVEEVVRDKSNPLVFYFSSPDGTIITFNDRELPCVGKDIFCPLTLTASISQPEEWNSFPDWSCQWSSDGNSTFCGGSPCQGEPFRVYQREGKELVSYADVYKLKKDVRYYDKYWSPDNSKVVVSAISDSGDFTSLIFDVTTKAIPVEFDGLAQQWSSDGTQILALVKSESETIVNIFDLNLNSFIINLGYGKNAAWQIKSGMQEWIDRKQAAINALSIPKYEWLFGLQTQANLPTLDESAAQALVNMLAQSPIEFESGKVEPFQRLVLQEEAIAEIQDHYLMLSNDEAEAWVDLLNIGISTLQILNAGNLGKEALIRHSFRSTLEHAADIITFSETNLANRETIRNIIDFIILSLFSGSLANPEGLVMEFGPEAILRLMIVRENQNQLIKAVQPAVDQGIKSVTLESDPIWNISGTNEEAELSTNYLSSISKTFSETAHENYLAYRDGLDAAEYLIDATDVIGLISGGGNPIVLFFQFWTRFQAIIVDIAGQYSYIYPAKECSMNMAVRSGEQAFQPTPADTPDCDWQYGGKQTKTIFESSYTIDGKAWQIFSSNFTDILTEYHSVVQLIEDDIKSKNAISAKNQEKLADLVIQLENGISEGFGIIQPPEGYVWDEQSLAMAKDLISLEGQTTALLVTTEISQETLNNSETQITILDFLQDTQTIIQHNQAALENLDFSGGAKGIGLIAVENENLLGKPGSTIKLLYELNNIGSGELPAGIVTISLNMEEVTDQQTPVIRPGQVIEQVVTLELPPELPALAVLYFTVGGQTSIERIVINESKLMSVGKNNRAVGGVLLIVGGSILLVGAIILFRRKFLYHDVL